MLRKETCTEQLGLREGRMRTGNSLVHNGGWYNSAGEKIGWGDIGNDDPPILQKKLKPGEVLVILGEGDSFWNFVTQIGMIGSLSKVKPDEQHPGVNTSPNMHVGLLRLTLCILWMGLTPMIMAFLIKTCQGNKLQR